MPQITIVFDGSDIKALWLFMSAIDDVRGAMSTRLMQAHIRDALDVTFDDDEFCDDFAVALSEYSAAEKQSPHSAGLAQTYLLQCTNTYADARKQQMAHDTIGSFQFVANWFLTLALLSCQGRVVIEGLDCEYTTDSSEDSTEDEDESTEEALTSEVDTPEDQETPEEAPPEPEEAPEAFGAAEDTPEDEDAREAKGEASVGEGTGEDTGENTGEDEEGPGEVDAVEISEAETDSDTPC